MKYDGRYLYELQSPDKRPYTWEELTPRDRALLTSVADHLRPVLAHSAVVYQELISALLPTAPIPTTQLEQLERHELAIRTAKKLRATETAVDLANILKENS